jgi:hypothetical protein
MKDFALVFRINVVDDKPAKEDMRKYMEEWMEWIDYIGEEGQLVDGGNQFSYQGKVIRSGGEATDSPLINDGQAVAGYIIIMAKNMEDASAIAGKCPILKGENTSVEIRELANMGISFMSGQM